MRIIGLFYMAVIPALPESQSVTNVLSVIYVSIQKKMSNLTLKQPDDWHIHLREGAYLKNTVNDAARAFHRAVVMPNLATPITTVQAAIEYRDKILAANTSDHDFTPLMTLYLTDNTDLNEFKNAKANGIVACKLYPQGATTNSAYGVTDVKKLYPVFEAMQAAGLLLLIHGEVIDPSVDIFDREKVFIESTLAQLLNDFPKLKIVLEHITTAFAADFVSQASEQLAATITAHHLWCNRNALLSGGIRPHYYCLPILKRETDRQALLKAATSGHSRFFIGTDSAPHAQHKKESACGCAGIYTALHAIPLYAQIFESMNALNRLEAFTSTNGPQFYGLPVNTQTITLKKSQWTVPESLNYGDDTLIPFLAGETLDWSLA